VTITGVVVSPFKLHLFFIMKDLAIFFTSFYFVHIISLQLFDKIKSTAYCEGGWLSLLSIWKERR
ncbi:TPA: hypothetical protein ACVW7B_005746, partial [Bacillus cereus]